MIGVHKHVIYHHRIISHQPKHILTPLISKSNFTQNPKSKMIDLERFNRWILMKLKTNVYDHDQKVLVLTDLMLSD